MVEAGITAEGWSYGRRWDLAEAVPTPTRPIASGNRYFDRAISNW